MKLYKSDKLKTTHKYGGLVLKATSEFGIFKLESGESLLPDTHECPEIFYIIKGELTVIDPKDKEKLIAERGDIVFIPAKQNHTSTNNGKEEVIGFWCMSTGV